MQECWLICRSLTYAQRTARFLERNGVPAAVVRAPSDVSGGGCGYAAKVPLRYAEQAETLLKNTALPETKTVCRMRLAGEGPA